jgi:hypothetical protein
VVEYSYSLIILPFIIIVLFCFVFFFFFHPASRPSSIRKVLATIAAVGISPYPWSDTKKVLLWCATNAIDEMGKGCGEQEVKSANESKQQLVHALGKFASLPFTGQRFSEILLDPRRFYSSPAKLAYALEKLLRVTATVPDLSPDEYSARLAELAKEQLPPVKPLMMALDADMRVPMTMMGEGGREKFLCFCEKIFFKKKLQGVGVCRVTCQRINR